CARGQVQAKTGTLVDAVALAGIAQAADGRDRVFVFLDSGVRKTAAVGSAIDTLATMVVGCHFG
ncbi:MAG TPA: D-alanyl-D-alanine carboxypeptidase, partial [Kineosporiaceae bacterium]|nr:D-alanyl-D-alanine carboxypeptidase [Kineosporiaceae bacterium]